MNGYNGWSNRATWNVNLWIMNDEGMYDLWVARSRCQLQNCQRTARYVYTSNPWSPENVQDFVRDVFGRGLPFDSIRTPDGDHVSDADFVQLADVWSDSAIADC
tara:strand:- start:612 stop:923 length:312 start_codon:yes stop_codon:yes gene_type:complete